MNKTATSTAKWEQLEQNINSKAKQLEAAAVLLNKIEFRVNGNLWENRLIENGISGDFNKIPYDQYTPFSIVKESIKGMEKFFSVVNLGKI